MCAGCITKHAIATLLLALACTANAETITGRVVGVADGDTITVLDAGKVQHKIRLAGIDAPEKKQAFGQRSKESLSELAYDKTVEVEISKRDRYGRQIGKVLVNGRDVNLVQVHPLCQGTVPTFCCVEIEERRVGKEC